MTDVGITALKQNASALVAQVAAGATLTVTVRGEPVARLTPLATSPLQQLVDGGRARPARTALASLPAPQPGPPISAALEQMREHEPY